MRITDLGPHASADNLRTMLDGKGWRPIGSGTFSDVFGKDGSNVAVKIGRKSGDEWPRFARLAIKDMDQHFPRIYSLEEFGGYYMAQMERLEQIGADLYQLTFMNIQFLSWYFHNITRDMYDMVSDPAIVGPIKRLAHVNPDESARIAGVFESEHPSLATAMRKIRNLGMTMDLHRSNVMIRPSSGTIVLVDPIV